MNLHKIRFIGSACLRAVSASVASASDAAVRAVVHDLHATLHDFRATHGFGRAISAPQIGSNIRVIAMDLRTVSPSVSAGLPSAARVQPITLYNPKLTPHAAHGSMSMFDDCMSAPDWVVRVRRHRAVGLQFEDESGAVVTVPCCSPALSELLQHEVDHLDGISLFDRADGAGAVVHRRVYDAHRREMDASVDYAIYTV